MASLQIVFVAAPLITEITLLPGGGGHEHETECFKDIDIKYGRSPMRWAAEPDGIAAATSCFCDDDYRYITGQLLLVDGWPFSNFLSETRP